MGLFRQMDYKLSLANLTSALGVSIRIMVAIDDILEVRRLFKEFVERAKVFESLYFQANQT